MVTAFKYLKLKMELSLVYEWNPITSRNTADKESTSYFRSCSIRLIAGVLTPKKHLVVLSFDHYDLIGLSLKALA